MKPSIVMTAAVGATDADESFSAASPPGACAFAGLPEGGGDDCDGGALGVACPQANVPAKTHSNQLLRINSNPPGWVHRKGEKFPSKKS